jgi:hypothetical protein
MLTSRKGLSLLCVSVVVVVSVALVIAKSALEASSSEGQTPIAPEYFEKTGKIKRITYLYAPIQPEEPNTPPLTCLEFEDGDALGLWGTLTNVKEGKTYRIVYVEHDTKTDKRYWTSTYYVASEIEEIPP